jgi:hypothetical protein
MTQQCRTPPDRTARKPRNGLLLFPADEDFSDHPVFNELTTVSLGDVAVPYGFFLNEDNGTKYVVPASPTSARRSCSRRSRRSLRHGSARRRASRTAMVTGATAAAPAFRRVTLHARLR